MTANTLGAHSDASSAPGSKMGAAEAQAGSQGRLSTPARQLLRFLVVVIFFCGVACLYFAQLSEITAIRRDTAELRQETMRFEQANAALMQDVAAWNRPDYILSRAPGLGLGPAGQAAYVQMPPSPARTAPAAPRQAASDNLWQQVIRELDKSWVAVTAVPRDLAQTGR